MILQQVRDEMNQVNELLDKIEPPPTVRGGIRGVWDKIMGAKNRAASSKKKMTLLRRATLASTRGIEALRQDILTREPLPPRDEIAQDRAMREAMRQDDALIDAFTTAECRLLVDMGVDEQTVARIRFDLRTSVRRVLNDPELTPGHREVVAAQLAELVERMRLEVERLQVDSDHRELLRQVSGALAILAGGAIVVSNGLVGAGLTPITGGLSAGGAALSSAVGADMISRGIDNAIG
ncbi:hypothetical protein BayCH28_05115 [Mycolicibacterium sp. CH28]|uniref:hypothetical protein n=1 Tax=Mycolicibacterium sp. CH28 TaxID=2512237 RepID=UPI00108140D1|nr:hypothetical protein [Mycolicibacterium sp. CH28]TGD89965.1 hypothetical protein BayCH28_05115 [Mycolicibacterium sp. CH28]